MNILNQNNSYNMSDKYNVISTGKLVDEFKLHGMHVDSIQSSGTRTASKNGFQKHLIRMSYGEDKAHGVKHQIVMFNSYDGSSSLKLQFGMFRFVCSNGMVAGNDLIEPVKIMHTNNSWKDIVAEFTNNFESNLQKQRDWIDELRTKRLSSYDIEQLAYKAIMLREKDIKMINDPMELTIAKRPDDRGKYSWEVYNRVQENLIGGNYRYESTMEGQTISRKKKELKDTSELLSVNTKLSDLIMEIA